MSTGSLSLSKLSESKQQKEWSVFDLLNKTVFFSMAIHYTPISFSHFPYCHARNSEKKNLICISNIDELHGNGNQPIGTYRNNWFYGNEE